MCSYCLFQKFFFFFFIKYMYCPKSDMELYSTTKTTDWYLLLMCLCAVRGVFYRRSIRFGFPNCFISCCLSYLNLLPFLFTHYFKSVLQPLTLTFAPSRCLTICYRSLYLTSFSLCSCVMFFFFCFFVAFLFLSKVHPEAGQPCGCC